MDPEGVGVDEAKWALLFGAEGGEPPAAVDELDDAELEDRLLDAWGFIDEDPDIGDEAAGAIAAVVGKQILAEDPPEVWATAQRLLATGRSRRDVVVQLTVALIEPMREMIDEGQPFDGDWYRERLACLPAPTRAAAEAAVIAVVTGHQGIPIDDLRGQVGVELLAADGDEAVGRSHDQVVEEFIEPLLGRVLDDLFSFDDGVLVFLADDRVVHLPSLVGPDVVLTTVVGPRSAAAGVLHVAPDLAVFARRADVTVDGVPLERCSDDVDDLAWQGPEGWLDGMADQVLAVRVGSDGAVSLERVDPWPELDDEFVGWVREAYDAALDDDGHPTGVLDVAAELALRHPGVFGEVRPPLRDVLAAAGLETRGALVAHSDEQWTAMAATRGLIDDLYELEGRASQDASRRLRLALARPDERDDETLRDLVAAIDECGSSFLVVQRVLLPDGTAVAGAAELSEALVAAARRPAHQARAHWVAALVAEADGDLSAAETHLEAGVRADRNAVEVVDRLAWYRSDRGDAAAALRLWRSIGRTPENHHEVKVVAAASGATGADGPKLGRNDPCWCGSGRKYKQCHLGQAAQPSLPDRVRWLYGKAEGHVRRGGRRGVDQAMAFGSILVDDEDGDLQALLDAMDHPLVFGLVLEHGGLDAFVAARGELLPDDERQLATSWLLTERSIHEVEEVRPGDGVTVRDLRTGAVHDVRDVAFSGQARPGQLVLAWVVPDGSRHQLLPGAVFVDPSSVEHLRALLDDGDAEGILGWLRVRSRPPRMATTDGEPVVLCVVELDVEDVGADAVRAVLDARYRSEAAAGGNPDVWHDLADASGGDGSARSVLVRFELDDDLGVLLVETHSESRMDAALEVLAEALPEVSVLTERRTPLGPAAPAMGLRPATLASLLGRDG